MIKLPTPDDTALAHSQLLIDFIAADIQQAGGWINFARFMQLALYTPDLGYYSHLSKKFGEAGDFITAPEISSLFGACLAQQIAPVLKETQGQLLELGAGSGKLALDLLTTLDSLASLPTEYLILEVSASLRQRQQERLRTALPEHLFNKLRWLDGIPASISGFIVANEVLDALPVHIVHTLGGQIFERGVHISGQQLAWSEQPITDAHLAQSVDELRLPDDYTTELNLAAAGLIGSMAQALEQGAMLWIDYGFSAAEYYHPQRNQGTLMCHYQHHSHDNPLVYPGLQDITAHVDFTAVAQAGLACGLTLEGYTNQAQFLINCGIIERLSQTPAEDVSKYLPLASQAQKLLSPAEMGELFKVIAFSKNISTPLLGFKSGNKAHTL